MDLTRLLLVLALAWSGCNENVITEFPEGLEYMEDNTAPVPSGDELSAVYGTSDEHGYQWCHGRARFEFPSEVVWETLMDPESVVLVERTDVQETTLDVEPEYEHSFRLHYEVHSVLLVEWDEVWRFGVGQGTLEEPELALINFSKVWGSEIIDLIEGTILVIRLDDARSEVQFIHHQLTFGGAEDDTERVLIERHAVLRASLTQG